MINYVPLRNIYPTEGGVDRETLGQYSTGDVGGPLPGAVEAGTDTSVDNALSVGAQASPLVGLLVFALLTAAVMWIAHKYGAAGSFSNIKASAYNVLFVSLVAVAGIPVWKFVFTKLPLPGVSTWVHSA